MERTCDKPVRFVPGVLMGMIPMSLTVVALLWTYWGTLGDLVEEWQENPDYSVGQLVPFIALWLIWNRRRDLRACRWSPGWWGILLVLAGQFLRLYGLVFVFQSAERYSLVVTLAGLVLLIAGKEVFYRLRWVLVFLLLMVPLPGVVHNWISFPLQNQATGGAVFFLELLGISVVREGNVLWLDDRTPVAIAEACSGLRMLTAFVIVAAVLAFIADRPRWQKGVLVLSSVPIAIGCNLFRLCACSVLFLHVSNQVGEKVFHDFAGLVMMPLAIVILLLELGLMNRIVGPQGLENSLPGRGERYKKASDSSLKCRRKADKK